MKSPLCAIVAIPVAVLFAVANVPAETPAPVAAESSANAKEADDHNAAAEAKKPADKGAAKDAADSDSGQPSDAKAAETAETYAKARRIAIRTGKPIVVMVGTDWCSPCQTMKKTILPRVRKRGLFRKVVFAMVNPDHDQELAEEITGGGPVPQLVMFRRTSKGWLREKLVGGQTEEAVEQFIQGGLDRDAADKKAEADESHVASHREVDRVVYCVLDK